MSVKQVIVIRKDLKMRRGKECAQAAHAAMSWLVERMMGRHASDADIRRWVTEAVRGGGVPGIRADAGADFGDFVIDRFGPSETRAFSLVQVRPKTPFGQ